MVDEQIKKTFLQQGAELYEAMIQLAPNDTIRRYLAFRIIVNAMAFEDISGSRQAARMRLIRNVFLAHQQQPDFFEGFQAVDEIRDCSIKPLLSYMATGVGTPDSMAVLPELDDIVVQQQFQNLIRCVLAKYQQDNLSGPRLTNNFFCFTGQNVHEVSKGELAGVFYRYNSSKALMDLAQYIQNNTRTTPSLRWTMRHSKLDLLLHAQNMADTAIKDQRNPHSISGLLEVMEEEGIGNAEPLRVLSTDAAYISLYSKIRSLRNRMVGHVDQRDPFEDLLAELDEFPLTDIHQLVNQVDKATHESASSHIAIRTRLNSHSLELSDANFISVHGLNPTPYY